MIKTVPFSAAGVGLMVALASHDAQAFAPMAQCRRRHLM
jgi:hypothetical protein